MTTRNTTLVQGRNSTASKSNIAARAQVCILKQLGWTIDQTHQRAGISIRQISSIYSKAKARGFDLPSRDLSLMSVSLMHPDLDVLRNGTLC